jgi:hypothetical protein
MEITEKEFLQKYGNVNVEFSSMYKNRATYKNEDLKIWCSGVLEYRDTIEKVETVNSIFNLEYFQFGIISENKKQLNNDSN